MRIGRRVLGAAAVLAGAAGLVLGHAALGPLAVVVHAGDAVLILGGIGINLHGRWAACAAIALVAYFAVSLALAAPRLASEWPQWVTGQDVAEILAMGIGPLLAWRMLAGANEGAADRIGEIARRLFGVCLLVFGISHVVYLKFTASLVPAWLPPSQVFWAWATGAAHIAAGLAILSGVMARRAAMLATAMFALFGLMVWLPAVLHAPGSRDAWHETGVNWLLVGAAWCVADWLGRDARKAG